MNELSREDQILLITEMIADIWGRYPDLRLGQLLTTGANKVCAKSALSVAPFIWSVGDIELISALEDFDKDQQEKADELADRTG